MLELLVFAPCEKVIVSGGEIGDGASSLISVMQGFKVQVPITADAEHMPGIPLSWFAFALWRVPPESLGVVFHQLIDLVAPSGQVLFTTDLDFTPSKPFHRTAIRIVGMPIPEEGEYRLRLWLDDAGDKTMRASFPILVDHAPSRDNEVEASWQEAE